MDAEVPMKHEPVIRRRGHAVNQVSLGGKWDALEICV